MRVLIAGGGTAGHVEPALNTADAIMANDPDATVIALGTSRGLEVRLVPARGYELELIPAVPLPRKPNRDLVSLPTRMRRSVRHVREILTRHNIDVVVGFGGYVAMPAYLGARGRVPIVIHEANAKAGLANKMGARFTPYVAETVPGSIPRAVHIGLPLRTSIVALDRSAQRAQARQHFNLDPDKPCLLVFGGSQGARRVNDAVAAAVPALVNAGNQVLHIVGSNNLDQGAELAEQAGYHQLGYCDRMDLAYAAADLALCRSGAMTCAELAAVGLPAIYVPLPIGNGEQRLNAAGVVAAGGGKFLLDEELSGPAIVSITQDLLGDRGRLDTMSAVARSQGSPDSAAQLVGLIHTALKGAPVG